jgi:hypothetical protein
MALNGLRREEGEFSHAEWVDRIGPLWVMGVGIEHKTIVVYRQWSGEKEV